MDEPLTIVSDRLATDFAAMRIRWLFLVILLHCFGAAGAEVVV